MVPAQNFVEHACPLFATSSSPNIALVHARNTRCAAGACQRAAACRVLR
jgi:hypothetical protein